MLYFASCPSQAYKADSMYIDLTCDNKFKQKKEAMISTGPIIYALALHQIWPNCQSWRNKHPTACILTFIPELEGTKTNNPPPKRMHAISNIVVMTDRLESFYASLTSWKSQLLQWTDCFTLAELLYLITLITEDLITNVSPSLLWYV